MTGAVALSNLVAWSLQVTLLVGAAFAALALLRVELPALRYSVLRVLLAVCLLLPLVQPVRTTSAPPTRGTAISDLTFAPAGELTATPRPPSPVQIFDTYAPPIAAGVIAAGVLARLCWMAVGGWRLRRLRRAGTVVTEPEYDELARAIDTRATIRRVAGLGQPATFGVRDPVVLLPASIAREPRDIQLAVVAHELWHVRRRDWLWTVVEEALRAVFWWHPAMWILLSRIQGTREEVVDRLAIEATGSRRTYVDALLTYAGESPLCGSTAFGRRRHLVHRLVLISKEVVMSARRVVICGALLVVVIAGSGWYAVQAFPMQAFPTDGPFQAPAGPLEQQARPVTPENPIPRRTWHVPADYPAELTAIGWSRMGVTLRITLDASGSVAEARAVGVSWSAAGVAPRQGRFGASGPGALETIVQRAPEEMREAFRQATLAGLHSALSAVRQWRYDPPADAPISFSIVVPLGTEPPSTVAATEVAPGVPAPPGTRERPGFDASRQDSGLREVDPDALAGGALRIGGTIKAPTKIRHVNPVYPPDAMDARVQGVVIIECRIEPDGTVSDVQVLRSIPMLDEAAIQAVQQWEFTPTLLNGVPMPVIMTVTVNFTLQ
jgi:TonB family protein